MFTEARSLSLLSAVLLAIAGAGCGQSLEGSADLIGANDDVGSMESELTGSHPVGSALKTTANLNLRSGAGATFAIQLVIPNGATVTLVASAPSNGFYKIRYGSMEGWSSGSYLSLVAVTPPPTGTNNVKILNGPVVAHAQAFANVACAALGCPYSLMTRPGHSPTQQQAIDFMQSSGGVRPSDEGAHGDAFSGYGLTHFDAYNLMYVIWEQRIHSNDGRGWRPMEDRGSLTANHYDHVHISYDP